MRKKILILLIIYIQSFNVLLSQNIPIQKKKYIGNCAQEKNGPLNNLRVVYTKKLIGIPNQFPIVYNGKIFIGTNKGYLYCLSVHSGALFWIKKLGNNITTPPVLDKNFLYISNSNQTAYKLNTYNGSIYWKRKLPDNLGGCVGIYNNFSFFISLNKKLYKLNSFNGKTISAHDVDIIPSAHGIVEKNVLYMPGANNTFISYDLNDMRTRFSLETEADLISPPLIGPKNVYITGRTKLYAIDKVTGRVVWIRRINIRWFYDTIPRPKYYNNKIFLGKRGFNILTGLGEWIVYGKGLKLTNTYIAGGNLYYGGKLYFPQNNIKGFIQIFNIASRASKIFFKIPFIPEYGLTIYNKMIILFDKQGILYGISGS